jgi:glycyl-tRNA synthetase beta chain
MEQVDVFLSDQDLIEGTITLAYMSTPRRIAVWFKDLPSHQSDRDIEKRGPRCDAPYAAREGFLRSLKGLDFELEERSEAKGKFIFARIREKGRSTTDVLLETLPKAVQSIVWPKSMRWADGELRWVRPLHSILCLFDGKVVPLRFGGLTASDITYGHRFLAPQAIRVSDYIDYQTKLGAAKVRLDREERGQVIVNASKRLADQQGLRLLDDAELLDELKGLVEWPVPLMGRIDEDSCACRPRCSPPQCGLTSATSRSSTPTATSPPIHHGREHSGYRRRRRHRCR